MNGEELKIYKGKQIKISLKNKHYYSGIIVKIMEKTLQFKDKFGNIVLIDTDEIATAEPNRGVK